MGDEHHRRIGFTYQVAQQIEDLRLNGHVQRRRRLIGDHQPGVAHHAHCDHHALAHTPGKLVGVVVYPVFRVRDAHRAEHVHSKPQRLALRLVHMHGDGLHDLRAHPEQRIE